MARAAAERPERRRDIGRALYACIRERGYAHTSLKDIAERADMSPSHIGYYFDNKAAILEYLGRGICRQNLAALPDRTRPDVERIFDEIADFCFGAGQMDAGLAGVITELSGLAVHDPVLFEIKADHQTAWREYLERTFERPDVRCVCSPREAAWRAHAMLIGLTSNALFDRDLDIDVAKDLFRRELMSLAGIDAPARGASVPTPV